MRRRRLLPTRAAPLLPSVATQEVAERVGGDLTWLRHVVAVRYPVAAARTWLQRALGNEVRVHLVEATRGERPGVVRAVEVLHANGGERSLVLGRRLLASGDPASFFVPDHLVNVAVQVDGPLAGAGALGRDDIVVLHVPVRSYLAFLPEVLRGEGPVREQLVTREHGNALQRAGGAPLTAVRPAVGSSTEGDPADALRRFLFLFQHLMTTVTERVDALEVLTDPLRCDPSLLPWLASWVDFDLDASLPLHQQRELVARAISLYRTRGTRLGIEEMVRVLTAAPARVREVAPPRRMVLGRGTLSGGGDVVGRYRRGEDAGCFMVGEGRRPTAFFELLLEARAAFQDRFGERAGEQLRRIVDVVSRERPAHVQFTIRFEESP